MTLALYRKYRPATFAEVVGQEHVTEPLRTALAAGRINHAYLFSGPRGCGKTSSARILARSLNCLQGPTPDPCGVCPSCVALAPEGPGSIDVVELDAASHGGVDDARDLRDRAFYAPADSRYRVFIIDEAHMVTTQGFNALLKIVEEPPEHLVFVFATTEPEKVLATIRSRTHHYPFRLLPPSTMRALLEQVCTDEGAQVEPAVYPLVIRAGGGSARDSLSVLDQLLAGAGTEGITYSRAVTLLGVTDVALIDDMVLALAAQDGAAVFTTVDRLIEAGHDPRRFAADLLGRLRDLVLLRVAPDAARRGLVDAPEDQLATMTDQAKALGIASLTRFAEIVHTGLTEMRGATAPRLLLELLCARMLLPAAAEGEGAVLHRLERLEQRLTTTPPNVTAGAPPTSVRVADQAPAPPAPISRPAPAPSRPDPVPSAPGSSRPDPAPPRPAPPDEQSPPSGELDVAAVQRVWQALLDAVREQSRATQALLSNATVTAVERDTLVLTLPTAPLARRLADERNTELIKGALRTVLGVQWQVRCEHAGGDPAPRGAARSSQQPQRARPEQRPPDRPARASGPASGPAAPAAPKRSVTPDDGIPLPPEPPDPAEPPEPEDTGPTPRFAAPRPQPQTTGRVEAVRTEAADADRERTSSRHPDEVALELLADRLGARPIEGR
ncbi:MAG: DNA polymerase III subunit gamma and tau [Pseudonocardiales bacterium]